MTCSKRIGWYSLALSCWVVLWLLVDLCLVGAQDQPTSPPPPPDTTSSSPPTMMSWDDLEALSGQLSAKANDLLNQAQDLNQQLAQLQSSLTESTTLLAQSLAMRKQEALAAQAQVRSALNRSLWWQRSALVVGGGFVGYLVDGWKGAAIGTAGGAVADSGLEIAFAIRIKL